jgi:hypothetical protein
LITEIQAEKRAVLMDVNVPAEVEHL